MKLKTICNLSVLVLLLAVAPVAADDKSDAAGRVAKWESEYNSENLGNVADLYSEDGCRMPPNMEMLTGHDAIVAALKAGKDQGLAKVKISLTNAESSGTIGWGTGTYEVLDADGNTLDKGKWMNAYTKTGKEWTIQCDIWNSDMPVASTMEAAPEAPEAAAAAEAEEAPEAEDAGDDEE
jgi:ketosteroid isomerase-like protein